jgi:hypothetical protein
VQKYSHERVSDKDAGPSAALRYLQVPEGTRSELEVLLKLANSEQEIEVFYPEDNPARAMVAFQESEELFILYGCDHEDGTWFHKQVYLADEQIDRSHIEDYYPEPLDDEHSASRLEKEELAFFLYKSTNSNKVQVILRHQGAYLVYVLEK